MNIKGIEGIVTASGWDDDGSVLSISLKTNSEEEISILMDDQARSLMRQGSCQVRIDGVRFQPEDDWRDKIKINSFEVIKRL